MSLRAEVAATFLNLAGGQVFGVGPPVAATPTSFDSQQYPLGANINVNGAGVTLTADAVANTYNPTVAVGFTELVANIHATATAWLSRLQVHTPSAAIVGSARIGLGANATVRVVDHICFEVATDAGAWIAPAFAVPIRVPGGVRVSGSLANVAAAATTVIASLVARHNLAA